MKKLGLNNRIVQAALILCFGLGIAIAISLSLGAVPLSFQEIWLALLRQGNPINQTILWDLRLPRTLAAMNEG
ncbi:iron chelate uptake ABC transporter family permease subunit [Tychonema sp. BBK16]|uniref:iron chelate uptake ABC transporter family permease subunit n=1 Tax=Tychonema sp. BBK16 TaxID=2699888 RepID=UPI001F2E7AFD|nr:iron chelate uptake ABC transporter family permease subunit [Tychonema sp. BBK16]MCF6372444.1 iron chelate uptake ABC transporter family permease subunit [Tychonema sp. BBK16]